MYVRKTLFEIGQKTRALIALCLTIFGGNIVEVGIELLYFMRDIRTLLFGNLLAQPEVYEAF